MDFKICLCVLCGIPGSGKTSFCERFTHDLKDHCLIINVNYDTLLLSSSTEQAQLHDDFLENQDKMEVGILKTARQHVVKLVEVILHNFRSNGLTTNFESLNGLENVNKEVRKNFLNHWGGHFPRHTGEILFLIDDNMFLQSMRYAFYKLAKQYSTGFCELFMESSMEEALERNKNRRGRDFIGPETMENMFHKMEPPNPEKNGWEKYSIKLKTEERSDIVFSMVQEALANPVKPTPKVDEEEQIRSQVICSKNLIHQADLILRKCVARTMANGKTDNQNIKLLSKKVLLVKEDILNSMKRGDVGSDLGELSIPEDASKDETCDLYHYICKLFYEKLKML